VLKICDRLAGFQTASKAKPGFAGRNGLLVHSLQGGKQSTINSGINASPSPGRDQSEHGVQTFYSGFAEPRSESSHPLTDRLIFRALMT
jgi:hypothetical protein